MAPSMPQPVTGKRKRGGTDLANSSIHVTVGTYERALHGFAITLCLNPDDATNDTVDFADTFLLNAHNSSIRCLAISPPSGSKRILATGSSDERINLYQLSTIAPAPPSTKKYADTKFPYSPKPLLSMPSLSVTSSQRSRELGSLMHHASTITALAFPSYSKLITTSLDNTLSILRTRDWTHLVTMRAPAPKARGRPDGDTAGPGETPAGVVDVAVHPSQRLAISVGLGERCMRLWNLVGGKKAGVLVFERRILELVGEPKKSLRAGEGRRIVWREDGQEFAVAFERGVAIFSLDCQPKAAIALGIREKVGQLRYLPRIATDSESPGIIVLSTEAGDLLFYSNETQETKKDGRGEGIHTLQLMGKVTATNASGLNSRIKDFQLLPVSGRSDAYFAITGSSDGAVRIWAIDTNDFTHSPKRSGGLSADDAAKEDVAAGQDVARGRETISAGRLIGLYETGKRITCLNAFMMDAHPNDGNLNVEAVGILANVPGCSSSSDDSVDDDVNKAGLREDEDEGADEVDGPDFEGFNEE